MTSMLFVIWVITNHISRLTAPTPRKNTIGPASHRGTWERAAASTRGRRIALSMIATMIVMVTRLIWLSSHNST